MTDRQAEGLSRTLVRFEEQADSCFVLLLVKGLEITILRTCEPAAAAGILKSASERAAAGLEAGNDVTVEVLPVEIDPNFPP
jgi:hypothetical protein